MIALTVVVTVAPSRFIGRRRTHVDLKLAMNPAFIFSVAASFSQAGGNGLPLTFVVEHSVALVIRRLSVQPYPLFPVLLILLVVVMLFPTVLLFISASLYAMLSTAVLAYT